MLEQAKDKYSILIEELENVIATIDRKIKNNEQRKAELVDVTDKNNEEKEKISNELSNINASLSYLMKFENKNIFITVIKGMFKGIGELFYYAPASITFFVILLSIYVFASFLNPTFAIAGLACFSILLGSVSLYITYDVKKERKLHSIADLENKKKELEEELKEIETRLKSSEKVDKSIIQERLKLNALKEECLKIIEYIRNSRGLAIESIVSSEILNEVYDNNETLKGVKQRIREMEKEGLV